jgi:superfamily II DNA helicase RecQ
VHGGVAGVLENALVRGKDAWRAPYAAQRELRVEQLESMARFARGARCRMLSLVEHFGDQEDSGDACGHCDVCEPTGTIKGAAAPSGGFVEVSAPPARGRRGRKTAGKGRKVRKSGVALPSAGPSADLVATLRAWRLLESKKKRVPAFRVMTNRALVAIADARPVSSAALGAVKGVGPKLLKSYGTQLVALCSRPRSPS